MITYNLETIYDSHKSFYGKAKVVENDLMKSLYSYDTLVATLDTTTGNITLHPRWNESQTTLRHVKEFLKQNDCFVGSKSELEKYYC